MATWKIHRFRNDRDLCDTLNGAITSVKNGDEGFPVDTLTLIINAGGGDQTVTFAPAKGRYWTLEEIIAAINAAHVSLAGVARIARGLTAGEPTGTPAYLRLVKDNGTTVTVKSTGTANTLFGFSAVADTVGVPYADTEVESRVGVIDNKTWYAVTYK